MNTQYQETQHELKAETESRVLNPEGVAAKEEIAPQRATEAELLQAFQRLKTKDAERLLQMDFEEVLALLREESRKRLRRRRVSGGIFGSLVLTCLLIAVFKHDMTFFSHLGGFTGMITAGAVASRKQRSAALALSQFDDLRAIGPLAETLEFKDRRLLPIAAQSLICLLPRLKASDASLLNSAQRTCLNRAMRGKNTDLTLAILKAWEQLGDADAVPEVEKLAQGQGRGGRNLKVMTAARECLPFLRQSAERQQIGSQLLRPADGNLTPSDVLLRPAMPHVSTEPSGELLRPTDDAV
jgi:hypothetical protein